MKKHRKSQNSITTPPSKVRYQVPSPKIRYHAPQKKFPFCGAWYRNFGEGAWYRIITVFSNTEIKRVLVFQLGTQYVLRTQCVQD